MKGKYFFIVSALLFVSGLTVAEEGESVFEKRPDIATIIGNDPRDIIDVRKAVLEVDEATHKPIKSIPSALSDVSELTLTANEAIPTLYLIAGNPTTIEFTDITGAPWPIAEHKTFSSFLESKMVSTKSMNALWIVPKEMYGEAVVSVYLKDLDTVVSILCVGNAESYHRTKTVKIMKLGVNAVINRSTVQEAEEAGSDVDEDLLSAAYGVRPNESRVLQTNSDSVIAWEKGNVIFVYSSMALMTPRPTRIKTGTSNGWTAFKVKQTSRLTFTNETGNVVKVKIESKPQNTQFETER